MSKSSPRSKGDDVDHTEINNLRKDALTSFHGAAEWSTNSGATAVTHGDFDAWELTDAATESVRITGYLLDVRSGGTTPTKVYVLVIPEGSGNIDWSTTTDFAAVGQVSTTHSDAETGQLTAVTVNEVERIDITDSFTGAAANDFFGLIFIRNGASGSDTIGAAVNVIGLLIEA